MYSVADFQMFVDKITDFKPFTLCNFKGLDNFQKYFQNSAVVLNHRCVFQLFVTAGPVSFLAFCFCIVMLALSIFAVLFYNGRDTSRYRGKHHQNVVSITFRTDVI